MVPLMLGNSRLKARKGPQDPKLLATSLGHPRGDISFGYHGATNLVKSFSYGPEEGPCRELGTAWPSEFVKAFPRTPRQLKYVPSPVLTKYVSTFSNMTRCQPCRMEMLPQQCSSSAALLNT